MFDLPLFKASAGRVEADAPPGALRLRLAWRGGLCRPTLVNLSSSSVAVREVVLYDGPHGLPGSTPVYGEAFQMLSQVAGTLAQPADVGTYPDRSHYRLPEPGGLRTAYGALLLSPRGQEPQLIGFTSCRRFSGRLGFDGSRLRIALDTEGLALRPGETWELEEWGLFAGPERDALFAKLARRLARHHPPIHPKAVPTGWCSWYTFGPEVTAKNVADNLDWIAAHLPSLRYIQIDDGYQSHMGDWLEVGKAFGGDLRAVLRLIRAKGFEPAIWVAPFIAEERSRLFSEHSDWFVRGDDGRPMPSDRVGFGGWRRGPWYCLDGTHPQARQHLERLFRTMRQEWGCTYFKLDANYWGAIHGGRRHEADATRIEAYRRGMEAIRRGAGPESVLLGCNHPLWPSLGLIHASRSSNDIGRSWESFRDTGQENLRRGWQNGRLWWNDPDCLLLTGGQPENEFLYHATLLYATGGMALSGDDMPAIPAHRLPLLQALLPSTGVAARFAGDDLDVGRIPLPGRERWALFNHGENPARRSIPLERRCRLRDLWSREALGVGAGRWETTLPPRSARLIEAIPVRQEGNDGAARAGWEETSRLNRS